MKKLTKNEILACVRSMIWDAANVEHHKENPILRKRRTKTAEAKIDGVGAGLIQAAAFIYQCFVGPDFAEFSAATRKDHAEIFDAFISAYSQAKTDAQKMKAVDAFNARAAEYCQKEPEKTAKEPEKTAKKPEKEVVPVNGQTGKPYTGKNKEILLAYLKEKKLTDGRFFPWGAKDDAGYRVKAGESGIKLVTFANGYKATFPVWHISQLVEKVQAADASAVKETIKKETIKKETIKREITLDGKESKKKSFAVTVRSM